MEEMLRQINPGVEVTGYDEEFCDQCKKILDSSNVDYWIDACDSVKAKVSLASNLGKLPTGEFFGLWRRRENKSS